MKTVKYNPERRFKGMNDVSLFKKELGGIVRKVLVGDVMVSPAMTINRNHEFSEVEEIFLEKRIRHLPVVDDDNKLVGIVSQRDVYRRISPRRSPNGEIVYAKDVLVDRDGYYEKKSLNKFILKYVMHENPKAVCASQSIGEAIEIMTLDKAGCVPVVDRAGGVVGIITRHDILKLAYESYKN